MTAEQTAAALVGSGGHRPEQALALRVGVQIELVLVGEEDGFVCVHASIVRP